MLSLGGECDWKLFRKENLPCDHMLEQYIFAGSQMEPNWERYTSIFNEQKVDMIYEAYKWSQLLYDSQSQYPLNALARSKFDLDK